MTCEDTVACINGVLNPCIRTEKRLRDDLTELTEAAALNDVAEVRRRLSRLSAPQRHRLLNDTFDRDGFTALTAAVHHGRAVVCLELVRLFLESLGRDWRIANSALVRRFLTRSSPALAL